VAGLTTAKEAPVTHAPAIDTHDKGPGYL